MKYSLIFLMLFAFLINISTECYCQNKIYIGWFNDENRSVVGRGCWTGTPYYSSCGDGDSGGGIVEGYWGIGEVWLWVCTGNIEINNIFMNFEWGGSVQHPDGCNNGLYSEPWNSSVVLSADNTLTPNEHIGIYWGEVQLDGCQKDWFWILHIKYCRVGSWDIWMNDNSVATLCDEAGSKKKLTILSHYILDPVVYDEWSGEPTISNENCSWGAIKSLCR